MGEDFLAADENPDGVVLFVSDNLRPAAVVWWGVLSSPRGSARPIPPRNFLPIKGCIISPCKGRNMKLNQMGMSFALGLLAAGAIWLAAPQRVVRAQTTTAVFTMAGTSNTDGVVIVDQSSGAVTYCTSNVTLVGTTAAPTGVCTLLGRATPGSGATSLSVTASASSVFILNNQTGAILQCSTLETSLARPEGSCVSQGNANK